MTILPILYYLTIIALAITGFTVLAYVAIATVGFDVMLDGLLKFSAFLAVFALAMIPTICFVKVSKEGERVNETY